MTSSALNMLLSRETLVMTLSCRHDYAIFSLSGVIITISMTRRIFCRRESGPKDRTPLDELRLLRSAKKRNRL